MKKTLIVALMTILFKTNYGQNRLALVFKHEMNSQVPGETENFKLYYIVDSNFVFKTGGINYYRLTFSQDSHSYNGFIGYDKKSGEIKYILDTSRQRKLFIQIIFTFGKSNAVNVSQFPFLGNNIILRKITTSAGTTFKPSYSFRPDSHSVVIKQLEFEKGKLYPKYIVFAFPFDIEATTRIKANQY